MLSLQDLILVLSEVSPCSPFSCSFNLCTAPQLTDIVLRKKSFSSLLKCFLDVFDARKHILLCCSTQLVVLK